MADYRSHLSHSRRETPARFILVSGLAPNPCYRYGFDAIPRLGRGRESGCGTLSESRECLITRSLRSLAARSPVSGPFGNPPLRSLAAMRLGSWSCTSALLVANRHLPSKGAEVVAAWENGRQGRKGRALASSFLRCSPSVGRSCLRCAWQVGCLPLPGALSFLPCLPFPMPLPSPVPSPSLALVPLPSAPVRSLPVGGFGRSSFAHSAARKLRALFPCPLPFARARSPPLRSHSVAARRGQPII